MCVPNSPPFQRCQVYDWPPFFNKIYMNGPIFLDSYVKDPIFLIYWYMHIFFAQRFFKAAYPLGIIWIVCDICVTTSKKWVQKIKAQYMSRSTFWMIKYMNGSVFSKARYMNGVDFEILARTPVPKLPLYPPRGRTYSLVAVGNSVHWLSQLLWHNATSYDQKKEKKKNQHCMISMYNMSRRCVIQRKTSFDKTSFLPSCPCS